MSQYSEAVEEAGLFPQLPLAPLGVQPIGDQRAPAAAAAAAEEDGNAVSAAAAGEQVEQNIAIAGAAASVLPASSTLQGVGVSPSLAVLTDDNFKDLEVFTKFSPGK